MRGIAVYSFAVAVFLWFGQMLSSAEMIIDGVPIPDDAHVSAASPSASETQKRLLGAWVGAWGGSLRHILIVEDIRANGEASVVSAIGDSPAANIVPGGNGHYVSGYPKLWREHVEKYLETVEPVDRPLMTRRRLSPASKWHRPDAGLPQWVNSRHREL